MAASYHSYKTSSYFTRDGSPSKHPRTKPSYSSSASDEDIIASLKGLVSQSRTKEITSTSNSSTNSSRCGTPGTHVDTISTFNTPSRKKSDAIPITIEQSTRKRVYTPLTGRGELLGGYFPGFADEPETLKSTTLVSNSRPGNSPETKPFSMSSILSSMDSPVDSPVDSTYTDTTARGPPSIATSPFTMQEILAIPKGKYYPSNYTSSPTSPAQSIPPSILNGGNLQLPTKNQRQKPPHPNHQRSSSDIKRKLQKYQRDMIEQARMVHAQVTSSPNVSAPVSRPLSPRLLPLGSPGPITPLELEESSGYLIAGQIRSSGLVEGGLRENETIGRMIRIEEERRRREGQSSPATRV